MPAGPDSYPILAGNDLQLPQDGYPLLDGRAHDFAHSIEFFRADVGTQHFHPGFGVVLALAVEQAGGDELQQWGHRKPGAEPRASQSGGPGIDHRFYARTEEAVETIGGCRLLAVGSHRDLAKDLGAEWIGNADDRPPAPLDAAILFAPAGNLVPLALEALDRGGILSIAGIYLSPIPVLDYEKHLFYEKELRSVTANTRADGQEFLKIAGEIGIRSQTVAFGLTEANVALKMLKHDQIKGAAVLRIS